MKDKELKLEEIESSHTLGWAGKVISSGEKEKGKKRKKHESQDGWNKVVSMCVAVGTLAA